MTTTHNASTPPAALNTDASPAPPAPPAPAGHSRRRFLAMAAGGSLAGVLAAACGSTTSTEPSATAGAQTGTPSRVTVQGKLQVVQVLDFHPDHNAFLKKTIQDYAAQQNWALDLSDLAGFLGGTDIYQKLQAQKTAGTPVDLIYHVLSAQRLKLFDLTRDATPLASKMISQYGQAFSGARASHLVDGKWVGLPFYGRVEGYWARLDKLKDAGLDAGTAFQTWQNTADSALKMSNPDQNFYGWGMTVNRSGDGEYLVWAIIHSWGGALADQAGQIVTLDSKETVDAITWLSSIYRDDRYRRMLPPGVNAWNDTSNNEAYLAGQIGFTFNGGTLYAKAVLDKNPVAEQMAFVPKPLGPTGVRQQASAGHYLYFMNGSKNYEPSAQLAEYLLSDPVQKELWRISQGYVVPANEKRWDDPLIKDNRVSGTYRQVAFAEPPFVGMAFRGPITEGSEAVSSENVITDMMGEILAGKAVAQAVKDAHARAVSLYQTFGLKGK